MSDDTRPVARSARQDREERIRLLTLQRWRWAVEEARTMAGTPGEALPDAGAPRVVAVAAELFRAVVWTGGVEP